MTEVIKRTEAEKIAAETTKQAQEYYFSLSDVTTGKSAKESAEVIKTALKASEEYQKQINREALKRIKTEETAKRTAEQAQKYYSSLSSSVTGKSAKESALVIEASLKAAEERKKELASVKLPSQTGSYSLKSPLETPEVLRNGISKQRNNNIKDNTDKFNMFIKEKIIPFTKTKQFKYLAAVIAAVTVFFISAGIIKHNSDKNETSKGIGISK